MSDVRGQILDAIKSKALIGGVLQSVLSHMPSIVTVFYRYVRFVSINRCFI